MRYVRTGEWRVPNIGEWFEMRGQPGPTLNKTGCVDGERWILHPQTTDGQALGIPPALSSAINAVLDATTLPEISDAVEALRKCWRPEA